MDIADAKKIELIALLSNLGFEPKHYQTEFVAWYLSPFREEKTASFKVDTRTNTWHDFGTGTGGDTLNFVRDYHKTDTSTALQILSTKGIGYRSSFSRLERYPVNEEKSQIKIYQELEIKRYELLKYLEFRCIPLNVARLYCKEIHYTCHGKNFVAIGFKNDSGGYELRHPKFKGKSCDSISTIVVPGSSQLNIFEGFFDFLAALTHFNVNRPANTTVILNSTNKTAFRNLEKLGALLSDYTQVNLYMDNDPISMAGQSAVSKIERLHPNVKDYSGIYKGYKDFNEFIQNISN